MTEVLRHLVGLIKALYKLFPDLEKELNDKLNK